MTHNKLKNRTRQVLMLLCGLFFALPLTGCVVMGGSSRGGFFIWPGGLGLVVIIVLIVLLTRRR